MKLVIVESPFSGNVEENLRYLYDACLDCLHRGESPYASHGFFTNFLDDDNAEERRLGIDAGMAWAKAADSIAVYTDLGISPGMAQAIEIHEQNGMIIEYRKLRRGEK
jgi:hypothetical protein